jgi:peptidoglycan/xylan/chitin deacetylase (PgdA/CDA1 family)
VWNRIVLTALLCVCCRAEQKRVALTFDDLPFAERATAAEAPRINRAILNALRRHHAPATGFVIGERALALPEAVRRDILRMWMEGEFDLGNHTNSHADLNSITVADFQTEMEKGQAAITPFSPRTRYLRFPYNHTGETKEKHDAVAALLKAGGYRVAACTIDTTDYEFADVYARALDAGDTATAARARTDYLAYTATEIDYYATLTAKVFGRDVPQVMLLHASRLNADSIEQILRLFEQRNYRFVTLDDAESDPAYATPDTFVSRYGPMWGYRWAAELGIKIDGRQETDPPKWITAGN